MPNTSPSPTSTSSSTTSHPPSPPPTYLYKILPTAPPSPLPNILPLSPLDTTSGYIHLSTHTQVPLTASRFFSTATKLWILKVPVEKFGGGEGQGWIVWEEAGSDGVFPHLYGGGLGGGNVCEVLGFERRVGEDWVVVLGGLELEGGGRGRCVESVREGGN